MTFEATLAVAPPEAGTELFAAKMSPHLPSMRYGNPCKSVAEAMAMSGLSLGDDENKTR